MSPIAYNLSMNARNSTFGTERAGKLQEDLRQQISAAIVEQAELITSDTVAIFPLAAARRSTPVFTRSDAC